jgi:glycosyltransferase involved in cell wall biosynthesis
MEKINIFFLWAEITEYLYSNLKSLSALQNDISLMYWNKNNINSNKFNISDNHQIKIYKRTENNTDEIYNLLKLNSPQIIVVSGWMDSGYISACRKYKRINKNVKIVAGIDDQWKNTLRQRIGKIYYHLFYFNIFEYLWVSGVEQYHYARMLGYDGNKIIHKLYCGNYGNNETGPRIPCKFIYIGRLLESKGVDILIKAHLLLPQKIRVKYPLVIYGDGDLNNYVIENIDQFIIYKKWGNTSEIFDSVKDGAIGIMPSRKEQWGVSIHEYCQLGLPILISDVCGAGNDLLISNSNGYKFKSGSVNDLYKYMKIFGELSDEKLLEMSKKSLEFSSAIDVEKSNLSLMSIMYY